MLKLCGFYPSAVAAALLAAAPAPLTAQAVTEGFQPNSAKALSPNVYYMAGNPNVAIIVGSVAALVVDTGMGPSDGAAIAREAVRLAPGHRLYLTTTHFHPEHASGEGGFPSGTILIRPRIQEKELEDDNDGILNRFRQNPNNASLLAGVKYRKPDIVFDKDYRLDLGGVHIRLIAAGPAHTRGDAEILVEEDSVLITGDVVQNKVGPGFAAAGVGPKMWIAAIDVLAPLKPKLILPDHSSPGDGSLIGKEREFLQVLDDRAHALKAEGRPAPEAGAIITTEMRARYPDWMIRDLADAVKRAYAE
jgi:glyoxylase-like metal-dependent hydrolase (beta-lactamase superfamily II)